MQLLRPFFAILFVLCKNLDHCGRGGRLLHDMIRSKVLTLVLPHLRCLVPDLKSPKLGLSSHAACVETVPLQAHPIVIRDEDVPGGTAGIPAAACCRVSRAQAWVFGFRPPQRR